MLNGKGYLIIVMEILFSQVCQRDVSMAVASFKSLEKSWQQPWTLHLIEDGSVTSAGWDQLRSAFPNAVFYPKPTVREKIEQSLSKHPACLAFYRNVVFAPKIFEAPLFSSGDCHFCDSDVLFFRKIERLWPSSPGLVFLHENYGFDGYAHSLFDWAIRYRIPLAENLNCGMYRIPKGFNDLDKIEWFLKRSKNTLDNFVVEQECWAFLASNEPHRLIGPNSVLCTKALLPDKNFPAAIHFLGHQKQFFWNYVLEAEKALEREPVPELETLEGRRVPRRKIIRQIIKGAHRRVVEKLSGKWKT